MRTRSDEAAAASGTSGARIALPALVVAVGLVSGAIGTGFPHPVLFSDELVFSGAAERLAGAEGPAPAGGSFGYGVAYPGLLAPLYALGGDPAGGHELAKLLNALLLAGAVVPAYLLARRVARRRFALVAAALGAVLPTLVLAALVTAESLAYLVFLLAVLAAVRAMERPSLGRQIVAALACVGAFETRRQALALFVAVPAAVLLVAFAERSGRRGGGAALRVRQLLALPALLAVVATAGVLWSVARGDGGGGSLGAYEPLASGYDVSEVVWWLRTHTVAAIVMFGVIPALVLPFVARRLLVGGSTVGARAVAALTVTMTVTLLVMVSAFASTPFGLERVHERYLLYAAPLVFALFASWLERGGASRVGTLLTGSVAAVLAATLPSDLGSSWVDAPALLTLGFPAERVGTVAALSGFTVLLALLPGRARVVAALAAAALLVAVDARQFDRLGNASAALARLNGGREAASSPWIDEAARRDRVTVLAIVPAGCPVARPGEPDALFSARLHLQGAVFFNKNVSAALSIGGRSDLALEDNPADVLADGTLVSRTSRIGPPELVVAATGVELAGDRIASAPSGTLALWRVGSPLRAAVARSAAALRREACPE